MSLHDLLVLVLITLALVLLPAPGIAKMFEKAGIPSSRGWIPFYNTWEMVKATGIKKHWFYWQFIPVVGWFITLWIFVEFVKLFGKFKLYQHAATVLVPFIYLPYVGYNKKDKFLGTAVVKAHRKSAAREWIDAAVFAIVAATLIRTFVFEAYTIPTGSMEKTLLINDFLFVSKLSYGPRIPNTPLAVPFVHHTVPILNTKSYSEAIKIPYRRWFASAVKRNDVVVFNFPAGDTLTVEYDSKLPYYDIVRQIGRERTYDEYHITTRPVDKRENYIKRCVGIPGDTIEIKDGVLYVNNEKGFVSPTAATNYLVKSRDILDESVLLEAGVQLNQGESDPDFIPLARQQYSINLTESELEIVKKLPGIESVDREIVNDLGNTYPQDTLLFRWTIDNFGKLWIPKKGVTIPLTPKNIALYQRVIQVYEGNEWEQSRDGKVTLNGKPADSYTFKMNYFWMMGDNRHRSQDSRYWGFVPEDHVVGEAWLIWMSWDKGPRWRRMFSTIH